MKLKLLSRAGSGKTYVAVDNPHDPCYDANIHNPRPTAGTQEESQVDTTAQAAKTLAEKFPVGTRVLTQRQGEGTVINHSRYIHVSLDKSGFTEYFTADELKPVPPAKHHIPDVNRVHFAYNGRARSGILNSIEQHPSTGNILMWVREDGTGDLKAFNLEKLDWYTSPLNSSPKKQVVVEGVSA